jgi:Domain of unknown function (DUF4396)
MMGGSYPKALAATFYAELVSMNGVMAGMMIVTMPWRAALGDPGPTTAAFWFIMSIGLTVGFLVAYPINWWLVARGLKHGMMTIRPEAPAPMPGMSEHRHDMPPSEGPPMKHGAGQTSMAQRLGFAIGTFVLLAVSMVLASKLR